MSKKNKKFQLPKRSPILYLLMILVPVILFFAVAIPVKYVSTYKENRVYVFQNYVYNEVTEEHGNEDDPNHEHKTTYKKKDDVVWGDKDTITDFDFYLYCNEYNDGGSVSFGVFGVKNEKSKDLNIKEFTVRIGFFNSWLNLNKESSSRTVKLVDNAVSAVKDGTSKGTSYNPSISLSSVPNLPAKGPLPFTGTKELKAYALVSYTIKENGQNITKQFVLEYSYDEYMIEKTVFDAGTVNETFVKPSAGGIKKD
jgi:hypothetical protein